MIGMLSVIETGGKQYLVKSGMSLSIEKLDVLPGAEILFDKVLLTANDDGSDVKIGNPYIASATVKATCDAQVRSRKIRVVKFKNKVRYRRANGHRQPQTKITIK